jgi:hypothetical protein
MMVATRTDQPVDRLVVVARYPYVTQAEAARLFLLDAGIRAVVTGKEIVAADWALGVAVGDVRVEVMDSDAESAHAILKEMAPARTLGDMRSDEAEEETCLQCGAELPESLTQCLKCGWTFESAGGDGLQIPEPPNDSPATQASLKPLRWFAKFTIQLALGGFAIYSIVLILYWLWKVGTTW